MKELWNKPWKLILFGLAGFVVAVVLHNVFYAFFGVEEPVFFLLAVIVSPVTFFIFYWSGGDGV